MASVESTLNEFLDFFSRYLKTVIAILFRPRRTVGSIENEQTEHLIKPNLFLFLTLFLTLYMFLAHHQAHQYKYIYIRNEFRYLAMPSRRSLKQSHHPPS